MDLFSLAIKQYHMKHTFSSFMHYFLFGWAVFGPSRSDFVLLLLQKRFSNIKYKDLGLIIDLTSQNPVLSNSNGRQLSVHGGQCVRGFTYP